MDEKKLAEFVNQSGFPLQIGIANLIEKSNTGWQVLYAEHAWKNDEEQSSGFLDLALQDGNRTAVAVIECKRVLDSTWIFLQPGTRVVARSRAKAWVKSRQSRGWVDLAVDPTGPECGYCVLSGQDAKSRPILER